MKTQFIEKTFKYDGSQLKSLFAYLNFGVEGDSIVAWQGACDIPFDKMLDGEDLRANSAIRGANMLHFIVEIFGISLAHAVASQRLLASLAGDLLRESSPVFSQSERALRRDGDDLYFIDANREERKLSISIATVSPVSALIHFAVNVDNRDTPVRTASLNDFDVSVGPFAKHLLERFACEMESIERAARKVRPTTSF